MPKMEISNNYYTDTGIMCRSDFFLLDLQIDVVLVDLAEFYRAGNPSSRGICVPVRALREG